MMETTSIKFGKGPTEIIGKTKNQRAMQVWIKRQYKCSEVLHNLNELRNRDGPNLTNHKEENTGRIKNDQVDQTKLKNFLLTLIHPLQSESHTLTSPWNIYSGQIVEKTLNVNKAVETGKKQMNSLQSSSPEGFRSKTKF